MPPVRGPPLLRGGHQVHDLCLERVEIHFGKRRGVIKIIRQRTRGRLVLVQDVQAKLLWPPTLARSGTNGGVRSRVQKRAAGGGLGHEVRISKKGMISVVEATIRSHIPGEKPSTPAILRLNPVTYLEHLVQ